MVAEFVLGGLWKCRVERTTLHEWHFIVPKMDGMINFILYVFCHNQKLPYVSLTWLTFLWVRLL